MDRIKLINYLISRYRFKSYLEIGCEYNECFNQIKCDSKVGVDPERGGTHRMTSDRFFELNNKNMKFDIVFIDGLHHCEQVVRDISNSLGCLTPDGIIVLHDCNPTSRELEAVPRPEPHTWWNGDVWKAIVFFRQVMSLDTVVGDFDFGCAIIRRHPNTAPLYSDIWYSNMTYDHLETFRQPWLRLASIENIFRWLDMGDELINKIKSGTLFNNQVDIPNEEVNKPLAVGGDTEPSSIVETEIEPVISNKPFSLNISDLL